ncbi:MAG: hypothetical protein HC866_22675 [Leptolyngbyaceae cyanobacterium RU_5_1]|nr:hypothetical protein [Leptolyngbyaceae cyanobacterium RU_5_1]
MTNKHFVLTIDPADAWEKFALRDPLSHEQADFAKLAASEIGNEPGQYLIEIKVQVSVLESVPKQVDPEMESVIAA